MKRNEFALLLTLAALWGSSYLFMRVGAGAFGPLPFAGLRAGLAALLLLPLLAWQGRGWSALRSHWAPIGLLGLTQSALPFVLFSFAAPTITSGFSAILGASTPLFTAAIGWIWLGEKLDWSRLTGLGLGFAGVVWLAWGKLGSNGVGAGWAVGACLLAAALYGFSANYARQRTAGVPPLAVAAGSQLASALLLALPAAWSWPAANPGLRAWGALLLLAVACTAVAYVVFYRLIARVGASRTVTVTFLIPLFGVLWGTVFLREAFTPAPGPWLRHHPRRNVSDDRLRSPATSLAFKPNPSASS